MRRAQRFLQLLFDDRLDRPVNPLSHQLLKRPISYPAAPAIISTTSSSGARLQAGLSCGSARRILTLSAFPTTVTTLPGILGVCFADSVGGKRPLQIISL
jgi:hypothetical protein